MTSSGGRHEQLHALAHSCGVCTSYEDVRGEVHEATPESLISILQVLHPSLDSFSDIRGALTDWRHRERAHCLPPVVIAWDGRPAHAVLQFDRNKASGTFEAVVELEGGGSHRWSGRIEELAEERPNAADGRSLSKRLDIPFDLSPGYHTLRFESGGHQHEAVLIAAPTRAYAPIARGWRRTWGAFLPLYSLRSQDNWGAGEFTDLRRLREWVQELGGGFVGTLPLLAAFFDEPFEISPYSPVSRLFWNEFYLDIASVPELASSATARQLLASNRIRMHIETARSAALVDYSVIMNAKRSVLKEMTREFFASPSPRRVEFEKWANAHERVADYAEFRAVGERLKKPWPQWPETIRNGDVLEGSFDEEAKRYHMYVQWLADEQLKAAAGKDQGGGLYLDLPLGVNAAGYDVWRDRNQFAVGVSGGAPPDIVFPRGQNWGFVPLHPHNIRTGGYRYLRACLKHQMRFAKLLRIDHMPSFHRVFWIPPGAAPSDGAFVRYPAEELYAVFALESHRHQTMLVGEDLGTVPPEVARSMARHKVQRMYVLQYEAKPDPGAALPEPPASATASLNTHDMAPLAGFFQGTDIDERAAAGLLSAEKCGEEKVERHVLRTALTNFLLPDRGESKKEIAAEEFFRACLAFLQNSPAQTVLVNLEDLWGETNSQNVPSTGGDSANWRRKAQRTWEEFSTDPRIAEILRNLSDAVAR